MKNKAYILAGLAYGDETKGSTVDFLSRKFGINQVVRYNGGSQAAHNVVLPGGTHHTFSQFGSNTLNGGETFLSKFMLVNPSNLLEEREVLKSKVSFEPLDKLVIDERATVITPYHALANKIKEEKRGKSRHGSCGCGVGEARKGELEGLFLEARDLRDPLQKLAKIRKRYIKELGDVFGSDSLLVEIADGYREFYHMAKFGQLNLDQDLIFEGAQGMLLDEMYGFAPHHTWTDISCRNAYSQLRTFNGKVVSLGLIRSYMTRHGAGPFVTEDDRLKGSVATWDHNEFSEWQGNFRVGHLDLVAVKYSLPFAGAIDGLVVSHLDELQDYNKVCIGYKNMPSKYYMNGEIFNYGALDFGLAEALFKAEPVYVTIPRDEFIDFIEWYLKVPVVIESYGPTWEEKQINSRHNNIL